MKQQHKQQQKQERAESRLSDRDMKTFLDALENPPEPNAKLQQAVAEYKNNEEGRI